MVNMMADGLRVLAARSMVALCLHVNFQRLFPNTRLEIVGPCQVGVGFTDASY